MNNLWNKLSQRERVLSVAVIGLLMVGCGYFFVVPTLDELRVLDGAIEQLEEDIMQYARIAASADSIDEAFFEIEDQHSSAWTEVEIHERLRREIFRLALYHPGAVDVLYADQDEYLVNIPQLSKGHLKEGGDGYREYQISLNIPSATVENLVEFLRRIAESPQALQVDSLTLRRTVAKEGIVHATLEITRTVVDGAPSEKEQQKQRQRRPKSFVINPSFDSFDEQERKFQAWETEGCVVAKSMDYATSNRTAMHAKAESGNGQVFQRIKLQGGFEYILSFDMAAIGKVKFSVAADSDGTSFGEVDATSDGRAHRYELRFILHEDAGDSFLLRAPFIELMSADSEIYIDNVVLKDAPPSKAQTPS